MRAGGPFGALPWLAAVVFALALLAPRASGAGQTLYASFNADGSMKLSLGDGSAAGVIPPGAYTVVVNNNTPDDNFGDTHKVHLSGPGVDVSTVLTQEEEAQAVWTVTFQPNASYTFQDDYRPTLIHVVFHTSATPAAATNSGSSTSTAAGGKSLTTNTDIAGSAVVPARGALLGTVGSSGALALTYKGKPVTRLKPGEYAVAVADRATTSGFRLQRLHAAPIVITTPAFIGKKTTSLVLKVGRWWFFTPGGTKTYFFVVS